METWSIIGSMPLQKVFLIHRWRREDIPYVMYTEAKLRKILRHPSASAITNLSKQFNGPNELDSESRMSIEAICQIFYVCNK